MRHTTYSLFGEVPEIPLGNDQFVNVCDECGALVVPSKLDVHVDLHNRDVSTVRTVDLDAVYDDDPEDLHD